MEGVSPTGTLTGRVELLPLWEEEEDTGLVLLSVAMPTVGRTLLGLP